MMIRWMQCPHGNRSMYVLLPSHEQHAFATGMQQINHDECTRAHITHTYNVNYTAHKLSAKRHTVLFGTGSSVDTLSWMGCLPCLMAIVSVKSGRTVESNKTLSINGYYSNLLRSVHGYTWWGMGGICITPDLQLCGVKQVIQIDRNLNLSDRNAVSPKVKVFMQVLDYII